MRFETIGEGFVYRCGDDPQQAVAVGPRSAVTEDGELVCTYMVQSAIGSNDFVPMRSRSKDGGVTWQGEGPIWPELIGRYAVFCSVSRAHTGELFLYGIRIPIDAAGESFWSDATQGIKQNELIWAWSGDGGRTFTPPRLIPMPIPGSAEAPGVLCITMRGRWLAPYAPYNTFDPNLKVDRHQVALVWSDDEGMTWRYTPMMRFAEADSGSAEAWVIELEDGRLLGTCWHISYRNDGTEYPNPYTLSMDGGETWLPPRSTGIMGQSTALAALPHGRTLFIYNQRKHGEVGVGLAVARPTATDFGVEANQIIWQAEMTTRSGTSGEHDEWTDFSFGEPSVTLLADGTLFVAFWCIQPSGRGIRYVRLKMVD